MASVGVSKWRARVAAVDWKDWAKSVGVVLVAGVIVVGGTLLYLLIKESGGVGWAVAYAVIALALLFGTLLHAMKPPGGRHGPG